MMKRLLLLIILFLSAPGCVAISPIAQQDHSQDLFVQALEAPASQRTQTITQLENEYPQSPWTSRAKTVDELLNSRETLTSRIRDLERMNARQMGKNRTLEEEVERLRNDLEKLKQIIIDMEKRSAM